MKKKTEGFPVEKLIVILLVFDLIYYYFAHQIFHHEIDKFVNTILSSIAIGSGIGLLWLLMGVFVPYFKKLQHLVFLAVFFYVDYATFFL